MRSGDYDCAHFADGRLRLRQVAINSLTLNPSPSILKASAPSTTRFRAPETGQL